MHCDRQIFSPDKSRNRKRRADAASRCDCNSPRGRLGHNYVESFGKLLSVVGPKRADLALIAHWERLATFFDFPAEHWKHLRTTNVIESPFATVRLRERATRGAGSRTKGLLMAFKLLDMAQSAGAGSTAVTRCRWFVRE